MLRTASLAKCIRNCAKTRAIAVIPVRHGSYYPINDDIFGLTDEQQQVLK